MNDDDRRSSAPTPTTQSTRRKGKRPRGGDNLIQSLSDNIDKFSELYALSAENMSQIARCFQIETAKNTEAHERRMNIFAEVSKINGLAQDEVLRAAHLLNQNQQNTDFFYSLITDEQKFHFIQMILRCD